MSDLTYLLAAAVGITGCAPVLTWAMAAFAFRLSPPASMHWLAAAVLGLLAQWAFVFRALLPEGARLSVAFLLLLGSVVALRRGLQVFGRQPLTDREHVAVLGVGMLVASLPGLIVPVWGGLVAAGLAVLLVAGVLGRSAIETARFTGKELEPAAQRAVLWSLWAMLLSGLAVSAGVIWHLAHGPTREVSDMMALWGSFAAMVSGVLINFPLVFLVVMRLINKLRRISRHDSLTDLLNRRAMEESLLSERLRHQRTGRPYSVLLVDVDHFKRVNDTYGHAAGDAVLVTLSALLRRVARNVDLVARMGGEEFCLLLPDTSVAGALQAAERLRMAIERRPVRWQGASMAVTASVGVAEVRHGDETVESLLERADRALYRAKAQGRNCTVVAPENPSTAWAAPVTTSTQAH